MQTTIIEAIKSVMLEAGKALTAREAYEAIIQKNLYNFLAKDPKHVVLMQIRRHCIGLDFPSASPRKHFKQENDNKYYLLSSITVAPEGKTGNIRKEITSTANSLIETEKELWKLHEKYLSIFRENMIRELKNLTPSEFESFSRDLLLAYNFEDVKVTSISKDGGIDGHGKLKVGLAHLNVAFQCKRWNNRRIQRQEIDMFRGAGQGSYEQGIFFTTSSFTKTAIGASIKKGAMPVVLVDGKAIVELMIEKKFRVESNQMEIPAFAL